MNLWNTYLRLGYSRRGETLILPLSKLLNNLLESIVEYTFSAKWLDIVRQKLEHTHRVRRAS